MLPLMTLIALTGCSTINERRQSAAIERAIAAAPVTLPDLPAKCRQQMPIIPSPEGAEWWGIQVRWVTAAKAQNARTALCGRFYDTVRSRFGTK